MKILFLCQDLPYPPLGGINSKVYNLARYLASAGWECDFLCYGSGDVRTRIMQLEKQIPGVKVLSVFTPQKGIKLVFRKIFSLLRGLPPSLGEFYGGGFKDAFVRALQRSKYNAVHYDVINMAQYLPYGGGVPSLLSSNDAISLSYSRTIKESHNFFRKIYLFCVAKLIVEFEKRMCSQFNKVHVVSRDDAIHLKRICPGIRLETIPLAIDNSFIQFYPLVPTYRQVPLRVAFTGNLDIPSVANGLSEFLDGFYSEMVDADRDFDFYVLGPKAKPAYKTYLSHFPGVKYLNWVDNYKAFLASADIVLVLDKSGTGIKTRVLEAMALGRPVIGTSIAFSGLDVEEGKHCLLRNTPAEIGAAIMMLLRDESLRTSIGKAAHELILDKYTMKLIGPRWETLYKSLND